MTEFETSEQDETPLFSEVELGDVSSQLVTQSEFGRKIRLMQLAKEKSSTPEQILKEINQFKIARMKENEKGEKRHFHRTSIDSFKLIAEMGRMLSRSKLKKERPGIKLPGWSASDNVMLTRDGFDREGKLVTPGFSEGEVVGASGKGIIMVFTESIIDSENYDASSNYPTVSDLPVQEYCEVILANSEDDKKIVEQILAENNLSIPVSLKSHWTRE